GNCAATSSSPPQAWVMWSALSRSSPRSFASRSCLASKTKKNRRRLDRYGRQAMTVDATRPPLGETTAHGPNSRCPLLVIYRRRASKACSRARGPEQLPHGGDAATSVVLEPRRQP